MRYLSLFSGIEACSVAWEPLGWKPVAFAEWDDFPKAVLHYHWPDVPDLDDVTKITAEDLEKLGPFELIVGGSPCFPAGTLVLTDKGYVPIERLEVGNRVLTHMGRWRSVTAVGSTPDCETVVLKGNTFGLECTPNHPIYSADDRFDYSTKPDGKRNHRVLLAEGRRKIRADEMPGRLWGSPLKVETLPIPGFHKSAWAQKLMPEMNEDFLYFIGRWLGDGWITEQAHSLGVGLCDSIDKEQELRDCIARIGESVNRPYYQKSTVRFVFQNKALAGWLTENFGRYSFGKRIHPFVFGLEENLREALLRGLLSSDGGRVKGLRCAYGITTVSRELAEGIRILVQTLGWTASVSMCKMPPKTIIEGREVNQRDFYIVRFTRPKSRMGLRDDLHRWYRCRSCTPTGERKRVYNITVEEDHTYIANGYVVGNCQDLSVAGKRAGLRNEDGSLTRSGLFDHQMRIFELAREINGCRFCLWENVPGALSSNEGQDFAYVLGTMVQGDVPVPRDGWGNSGVCISESGDRLVEWRVLDAQHMGVPQRRRRIFALVDSGAWWSRPPVLFEPKGLPWNPVTGGTPPQGITGRAYEGADPDSRGLFGDIVRTTVPKGDEDDDE